MRRTLPLPMAIVIAVQMFTLCPPASAIRLSVIGTYASGLFDKDAAEIVAYDYQTRRLYITNAAENTIDVVDISDISGRPVEPEKLQLGFKIHLNTFGAKPNSVAVKKGIVAVAMENKDPQVNGNVVFFAVQGQYLNTVEVGASPDMVTFTSNGQKILVANEGNPNDDYTIDPEGSVSFIDLSQGVLKATVTTADFKGFNDKADALRASGVRIYGPGATVAQDLEPEFIVISRDSRSAWVTLQENNALAVVDIKNNRVTDILPLGFKNHNLTGNGLDASDRDGEINITNWPVSGMYQPDGIASYEVRGKTFLITANEGDPRDFGGFSEVGRVKNAKLDSNVFSNANKLKQDKNLGRLEITNVDGDANRDGKFEELFSFGARSFAIWTTEGDLIFDSGDAFEKITAERFPNFFNVDNDNNLFEDESDDQGPKPEAVVVGRIHRRTYAFIGLERIGGVMVYDITNPYNPQFVDYVNNRNFEVDPEVDPESAGDLGPEGLLFIPGWQSPISIPLLVVASEKSGTTTIYRITRLK